MRSFNYESMGTHWEVTIWDDLSSDRFASIQEEIIRRSQEFDHTYSRFIKTSFVWQLAEKTGVVEVPADFMEMLGWYKRLYAISGKTLNPLIGFTISDLGYDADYSLKAKDVIRQTPDLDETVQMLDDKHIVIAQPVLFDFGALGKGYFVDKVAAFLREQGIQRFLVNGSGDIYYEGKGQPIRVGLEDPRDPSKVIGVVEMFQGSMCASASNRRAWGSHHHTINPLTSSSPSEVIATWVLAPKAVLADAAATCGFLTDLDAIKNAHSFEYALLNQEFRMKRSPGFIAEIL